MDELKLTLTQEFELTKMRLSISELSRDQLEELALVYIEKNFLMYNMARDLHKEKLGFSEM